MASQRSCSILETSLLETESEGAVRERGAAAPRCAPRLLARWAPGKQGPLETEASLVFADVSGFTAATERLGRQGRIGAELMSELISHTFTGMLNVAESLGGDLLFFGGDALFLSFDGHQHTQRALRAAVGMRQSLRSSARARQQITQHDPLGVSLGVHTGRVWLTTVSDRFSVFFAAGQAVSKVLSLESVAERGEILVSAEVAAACSEVAELQTHPSQSDSFLVRRLRPARSGSNSENEPPVEASSATDALREIAVRSLDPAVAALLDRPSSMEHREAAVGFLQAEGLDGRSSADRHQSLAELTANVLQAAEEAGVVVLATDVAKNAVKFLLVAGVPMANGDDADRLVNALVRAVRPLPGLRLSAGAHCGQVFAGFVGSPTRASYTVMGDTVNTAARIMGNARSGEVAISEVLANQLRPGWDLRGRAPFLAKGKRDPLQTVSARGFHPERLGQATRERFVGRSAELDEARSFLAQPRAWVEFAGPAGIGKTATLEATIDSRTSTLAEGTKEHRILRASATLPGSRSPYLAMHGLLAEWLRPADLHDSEVPGFLDAAIRQHCSTHTGLAAALRRVFGLQSAALDLNTDTVDRRATHAAILRLLAEQSSRSVLLVVDDYQWLDSASSELVSDIHASGLECRIVSTRRTDPGSGPSDDGARSRLRSFCSIPLGPLSGDALVRLALAWTSERPILHTDLRVAVERSGGNPLLLQLLVQASVHGVDSADLPPQADMAISRVLDRLTPDQRLVLGLAALCGPGSEPGLVARILQRSEASTLAVLQSMSEFIDLRADTLHFKNTIVSEASYARLPFRDRNRFHAAAAEILESTSTRPGDDAMLANHFHRSGNLLKTWKYGLLAGHAARAADAPREAARHFQTALQAGTQLPAVHLAEIASAFESLGLCEQRNGHLREAERAFERATATAELFRADLLRTRGRLAVDTRNLAAATRWYRRSSQAAARLPGKRSTSLQAGIDIEMAGIRYRQGRLREAERLAESGIARARRRGDTSRLAHGLYLLTVISVELARPNARSFGEEAAELYRDLGDLAGLARTYNNLGVAAHLHGDWVVAQEYYRNSAAANDGAGDVNGSATIHNNLGEILSDQGHYDEALDRFVLARATFVAAGFHLGIALVDSNTGRVLNRRSRAGEGDGLLESATRKFRELGSWDFALDARLRLAESSLHTGDHERAESLLEKLDDALLEPSKEPLRAAHRRRLLAALALQRGRRDDAVMHLSVAIERAEHAGGTFDRACALLLIASLGRNEAEKSRRMANELFDQLGVLATARHAF